MRVQSSKRITKTKCLTALLGAAVASGSFIYAPPAFALFEFFDDFFVFREDQKDLVRPQRNVRPKHIMVPHYNTEDAGEWARYYTRDDLKPVEYMDNATRVMRPPAEPDNQITDAKWHAGNIPFQQAAVQQPIQQAYAYYPPGYGPMYPPPGYQAMLWRQYANQQIMQRRQYVYIGEPGSGPSRPIENRSNIGMKTKIGEPTRGWNSVPQDFAGAAPRVGDYNYKEPVRSQVRAEDLSYNEPGQVIIDSSHGRAYPDQYTVQQGDTLSTISEQDQIYGDWALWPLIYGASQEQISDPDLIRPQQNLGIPRDYTPPQEQQARQRARSKVPPHSYYDYE